jgi:hypothetical protein
MPDALHQDFDALSQVARLYNRGLHKSKKRLQAAQWAFDLKRKSLNHEIKVFNANAAKHPHAPVVNAVQETGSTSASTTMLLRDDLMSRLLESDVQHRESATAIIAEIREMRRVSSS